MLACLAHWTTAGLYASPVALVAGWLFFANRRAKREDSDGGPPDSPSAPPATLAS
jgi:hypothetical protein